MQYQAQGNMFPKTVLDIAKENVQRFRPDFIIWLADNLHVFEAFAKQAIAIKKRGYSHYSSRTIIEALRHHSAVVETDGAWKINNNITPFLPRLFDLVYPEHAGLWEYRTTKAVVKTMDDYKQ